MKKVFLSLALVAAMSVSFVSCKETKTEETEVVAPEAEMTPEVAPEAPADTMAVETTTTTAETPAGDASATTTTTEAAK